MNGLVRAMEEVLMVKDRLDEGQLVALGELAEVAETARRSAEHFDGEIRRRILALYHPGGGDFTDRAPDGASWADIGEALGTTGEAARKRYGAWVNAEYQKMAYEYALWLSKNDEEWAQEVTEGLGEEVED